MLTFDPTYMLSYILGTITCVFALHRPEWNNYWSPLLRRLFWDHPNVYYKPASLMKIASNRQIKFIEAKNSIIQRAKSTEHSSGKPEFTHGLIAEKAKDIRSKIQENVQQRVQDKLNKEWKFGNRIRNKIKERYEEAIELMESESEEETQGTNFDKGFTQVKGKLGLRETVKKVRELIGTVNYEIGWYFDLVEKVIKAFSWQNNRTSTLLLILLLLVWIVVTFIPIRFFIAVGLVAAFNKKSHYYRQKYTSNFECAKIAIRNLFYHEEIYDFRTLFQSGEWMKKPWPVQNKAFEADILKFEL